jgi:hypothetical protein
LPNRILRDGILNSPRVDQLSPMAEILYRRLMSVADDYGRFYGSARAILGACWPTHPSPPSETQVESLVLECTNVNLLVTYEARGQRYLELIGFGQQTRSKSKFPEHDINLLANAEQLRSTTRARTSPSTTTHSDSAQRLAPTIRQQDRFAEFIAPWPRVANPDHAARCWLSCIDSHDSEAAAFAARDRYLASDEVARGVHTDPAKWLMDQKSAGWAGKWPPALQRQPNGKASTVDRVLAKMQQRIANGERPL